MEKVENQTYGSEQVMVDGKAFTGCTFTNTVFVYAAGEAPTFADCTFHNVSLAFEGAADNTLQFLAGLYEGGFTRSIETIFESIRNQQSAT